MTQHFCRLEETSFDSVVPQPDDHAKSIVFKIFRISSSQRIMFYSVPFRNNAPLGRAQLELGSSVQYSSLWGICQQCCTESQRQEPVPT